MTAIGELQTLGPTPLHDRYPGLQETLLTLTNHYINMILMERAMADADNRKNGRNTDGTFTKGNSGKPRGARHKATQAALALIDGEGEALTRKAVAMALAGDTVALRLCMERLVPPRRDAPVRFNLPPMEGADDAASAMASILADVASGEITPAEAHGLAGLIEAYRKVLETTELEARLRALEERQA